MRYAAIVVLLTACASSDGLQKTIIEGGPGQPISVFIAGVDFAFAADMEGAREYTIQFEVNNNLDVPLTVERVAVRGSGRGAFQFSPSSQKFSEMLDPGGEHIFDVRARGRFVRPFHDQEARRAEFECIVTLTNGDSYLYTFEGPVREDWPSRPSQGIMRPLRGLTRIRSVD
jgi:hypothetical protein